MKRFYQFIFACFLSAAFAASGYALPSVRVATQFQPADNSRTSMDVGGVWNGSANVTATTGDAFVVTFTNDGDQPAYDLNVTATLPSGFHYVADTVVASGTVSPLPAVSAVQAGSQLTFTLTPAGFALPAGESVSIRYGMYADATVVSGSPQIIYNYNYALAEGDAPQAQTPAQQNILTVTGDSVIQMSAQYGTRAVLEQETFTIVVRNTSRGGLFNVVIDETLVNAANHLRFDAMRKVEPARPLDAGLSSGAVMVLPYLAPGEEFVVEVDATVLSCGNIVNIVNTNDLTGKTAATGELPIRLDLRQPLVSFVTPTIELLYNEPRNVSIEFGNEERGDAFNFVLHTTFNALGVRITDVAAGWTYNPADGTFTLGGNGVIGNKQSQTLTFKIEATDICANSGEGLVFYETRYTNACGDEYFIPQRIGSVTPADDTPSLRLSKSVSANRIAVKQSGTYTIRLEADHIANIDTAMIEVTDTLPSEINILDVNAPAGTTTETVGGVLTWRVPRAMLTVARELTIDFAVREDPCLAGSLVTNQASTAATTLKGCSLSAVGQAQFFVSNNPDLVASQFFDVATPQNAGFFETGAESADTSRDRGEGEFIPFEARYTFGADYPGNWVGSTYSDDFGGVSGQKLIRDTLTYTFNNGTTTVGPVAVPSAAVTETAVGFSINLSFLNASVEGTELRLNYSTTVPDSALGGAVTRSVLQRTNLVLAGGGTGIGICNESAQDRFTQGAFYTVGRAAETISIQNMPSVLELCKEETVRIRVANLEGGIHAFNPRVTLLNTGTPYEVIAGQTPVFGGAFAGNMIYDYNGGVNPTFTYTGEVGGDGWIDVKVIRSTGSTAPTGFGARVDYDSRETEEAGARVYNAATAYAPLVVHQATLALTVTPGTLNVVGTTVEYTIYLTNTNAGTAYNSVLRNTLPAGVLINEALTNLANPGYPVDINGQQLTWDLGNVASADVREIKVIADVLPSNCTIVIDSERITASWGCSGNVVTLPGVTPPVFFFPQGKMQVIHDSTQSVARLCDIGRIAIIIRNTGPTDVLDVVVEEVIPASSGIEISGTVQYRINGGALQNALLPPERDGDRYIWRKEQIDALKKLSPQGSGEVQEVRIEFDIIADNSMADLTASPVLDAKATATIACGNPVASPAQPFSIPMERPRLVLSKTGRNITANPSAVFGETVYGGRGDVVEWQVKIRNTGEIPARYMRLMDVLSQSNPTEVTVKEGLTGTAAAYTPGSWIALMDGTAERELLPGQEITYVFTERLGGNCVTDSREAQVTWGCAPAAPDSPGPLDSPGTPRDGATIVMAPSVTNGTEIKQNFFYETGGQPETNGRVRVEVEVSNFGGNAHDIVLRNTIKNGMVFDQSVAPVLINLPTNPSITGVSVDAAVGSAPVFTLTGPAGTDTLLRYGEKVTIRYYLRPGLSLMDTTYATSFPELAAVEEDGDLDPTLPSTATSQFRVEFSNSCDQGLFTLSNEASFTLRIPDLDIVSMGPDSSGNNLLGATATTDYTFRVTNRGDDNSIADNITLDLPNLGPGWRVEYIRLTTAGAGGSTATNATVDPNTGFYTIPREVVGTLAKNSYVDVRVRLEYDEDNSNGSLRLLLRARGEVRSRDGAESYGTGLFYSHDQRAQRSLGVKLTKTPLTPAAPADSSSFAESNGTNLWIGEEFKWLVRAEFRGGEEPVTNVQIRDQFAQGSTAGTTTNNFGFVGHRFDFPGSNHSLGEITPTSGSGGIVARPPVKSGRLDFTIPSITAAQMATGSTFEVELTGRVMNEADNTEGASRFNRAGMRFDYLGTSFHTDNASFGLAGATANNTLLYAEHAVQIHRPQIGLERTARNISQDANGPFLTEAAGQAGDIIEYRVVVTNPTTGIAPLYSIAVEDTVHGKVELLTAGAGADTNNDGTVEITNSAGLNVAGGIIVFNETNTVVPTAGQSLARLDPGQSIVLLYRVQMLQGVNPSEPITSTVTATGQSIPVLDGNGERDGQKIHSAHPGTPAAQDGALVLTTSVSTPTLVVDSIEHDKEVIAFSVTPADDNLVQIGEQIRYRISIVLPQGTVPNFTVVDNLPTGLALLGTPTVTIGEGISNFGTPPTLSQTQVAGGTEVKWEFGARVAQIGNEADAPRRTVTIEYVAQVRNIASNVKGLELTNEAHYTFTGLPGDFNTLTQRTVTIAEPVVTLVKAVAPDGPVQAGDTLTYTVTLDNSAGDAPAHDLNLVDTLPLGVTYVSNSTVGLPEPEVTGNADDGWVLVWGRTHSTPQEHDIATGATLQFTYQVKVDDTSHPEQVYANSIRVDWTSLDGHPGPNLGTAVADPGLEFGERVGTTDHNSYVATHTSTLTARNNTAVIKTAAGQTLPLNADGTPAETLTAFRIGDLVTYTLKIQVQEATLREFHVLDTLPAGQVLVSTDSITPPSGNGNFTYTAPAIADTTAPDAGATGLLTWDFGTMANSGDGNATNDEITLVYTARIINDAANPVPGDASLLPENSARVRFLKADNSVHVTDESKVEITVSQPVITIEKTLIDPVPENILRPGESGKFRIRIRNTGTAPAYNLVWDDVIPVWMRETAPVLTRADLNGTPILADLQAASLPTWNQATGTLALSLTDAQFIQPGGELVLEYTFAIDMDAIKGETLVNTATVRTYFGKPSTDTEHRREYNTAVIATASVIVGLEIRGSVYNDVEPNGQRDAFEDWASGSSVYVNLVNTATNTVYRSVQVSAGEGHYVLTRLPRGDYRIVITDTQTRVGAVAPDSWLFRMPQNGLRTLTLTVADSLEQNFGLYQGLGISGQVFRDTGNSGGTANDGQRNGGEIGLPGSRLRLINAATSQQLGETISDGNGNFSLYIPDGVASGTVLIVEQVNLPQYRSTGGRAGTSGGSYDRDTDRISFTFNGNGVTGLLFGDVPESEFTGDGMQRIQSGAAAYYRHTFVAGTAGTVIFDTDGTATPAIQWTQAIIHDSNCNGEVDGEPTVNGQPINVVAGQEICLIVREQSPSGAPYGAQNRLQVRARFTYSNASPTLNETLVCTDLTQIGDAGAAGLQLTKTVDKERAKPGEELTYTIIYTNNGAEPLSDLFIDDRTPHYTTFVSADYDEPPANLGAAVTVDAPAPGATGTIRWTFTGTLQAGASGRVTFKVQVLP